MSDEVTKMVDTACVAFLEAFTKASGAHVCGV